MLSPSLPFKPFAKAAAGLLSPFMLLASTLLLAPAAHAWNAAGHMTIGAIAESRLSDHAKAEVARLLPLVKDPRSQDFLTACVWMDDIRADGTRLYDRWHYDNLAFSPDGTPIGPRHADNVAWAVGVNIKILSNDRVADDEKARALRFLLHTVEDAHQPLHCGSRYTKDNPHGDSGGNQFKLENFPSARNLHSLWDSALGTFQSDDLPRLQSETNLRALAVTLTTKYPEASLPQSTILDPEKWVEEGSALLQSDVYPATNTPDAAYLDHCRPIAERQATLAGYRLARVLNLIWP